VRLHIINELLRRYTLVQRQKAAGIINSETIKIMDNFEFPYCQNMFFAILHSAFAECLNIKDKMIDY
jgi:hypothetical protein